MRELVVGLKLNRRNVSPGLKLRLEIETTYPQPQLVKGTYF